MTNQITIFLCSLFYFAATEATPIRSLNYVKLDLYHSSDSMYYINGLKLGTPAQSIQNVILDTGSSDFVIANVIYDSSKSRTFINTFEQYPEKYGSTDYFTINKVSDSLVLNSLKVTNFTMGYANRTDLDSFSGILGIGYHTREALGKETSYENLPVKLKSSGLTQRVMFSINGQPQTPSVLFGGIYPRLFQQPMTKVPFNKEVGNFSTASVNTILALTVNSIKLKNQVIASQKLIYEIDSGANGFATTIPILNNILTTLGDNYVESHDSYYYPISELQGVYVKVDIQGYEVRFPIIDIVGDRKQFKGVQYGSLNLAPVQIGVNSYIGTLPNCILKYYYTVYDLEENFLLISKYSGARDSDICAVTSSYNPKVIATKVAPHVKDSYSVLYQEDSETTLSAQNESTGNTKEPDPATNGPTTPTGSNHSGYNSKFHSGRCKTRLAQ
ncbi:aspartic peptidase domain-containing protein [Scheffersomyces xylosifermentans]|uniref:aspartic peptidase domain-containing protein n=1 Tax=Scheffersomyces xylosifermentans TaxID=1304137 RepID=UPI00315C6AAC